MNTRKFAVSLFALAAVFVPQLSDTSIAGAADKDVGRSRRYVSKLIKPRAGDVVFPGQQVRIEWAATLPNVDMTWCEVEIYLSLDGGQTFPTRLTPQLDPRTNYFDWTVPNTPSNAAVLDIHFGCEGYFPETPSVQAQSRFVIGRSMGGTQEVVMNSVSAAQAAPGDIVRVSWNSTVDNVTRYDFLVSFDRGAHFNKLAETNDLQAAWQVPVDFAGHATFRVVAQTVAGTQIESKISAEPQVIVRARTQ